MVAALDQGMLETVQRLAWDEFWEMHSLFHTSQPPFTYWEPGSVSLLKWLAPAFDEALAGQLAPRLKSLPRPIVTMDAGSNLHLLVPTASANAWKFAVQERFPGMEVLQDVQGKGGRFLAWGESHATLVAQECPV
jgi:mevalonate pyrophosphate decarboxylase